jgi:hypothetical protein
LTGCSPAEPTSVSPDEDILIDSQQKTTEDYSEWGTAFISRASPEGFTPAIRVHLRSSAAEDRILAADEH